MAQSKEKKVENTRISYTASAIEHDFAEHLKYTQDADYITVYYDPVINPLIRYEKFPVRAYGVEAFRIGKIEVEA